MAFAPNRFAQTNMGNTAGMYPYEYLIGWDPENDELTPGAVEWTFTDDGIWRMSLKDDVKWTTGDPVSAEDLSIQFRLNQVTTPDSDTTRFIEDVDVLSGDRAIEMPLTDDWNPNIVLNTMRIWGLRSKWSYVGDLIESLEAASSEDEISTVQEELNNRTYTDTGKAPSNGMFRFTEDSVGGQSIRLPLWEEHRHADMVNWNGVEFKFVPNTQAIWGGIQGGDLDVMHAKQSITLQVVRSMPDHVQELQSPGYGGLAIIPNHEDKHLQKRKVRQAFAHVINTSEVSKDVGSHNTRPADQRYSSVAKPIVPDWIGDDIDSFTEYNSTDQAEQLLREANFTKEGGEWVDSDGEALSLTIQAPSTNTRWVSTVQSAAGQLRSFGVNAEVVAMEGGAYWDTYLNSEFDEALTGFWGSPSQRHPYFQLFITFLRNIPSQVAGYPSEVSVPMPVGNPDGSEETINIREQLREIPKLSGSEQKERVKLGAWVYNQTLPSIALIRLVYQGVISRDGWDYPPETEPYMAGWEKTHPVIPQYWFQNDVVKAETN
jgi:peptide/nickel transport system substrate-binding protein